MVELELTGHCKDCLDIELDLNNFSIGFMNVYKVRCIHEKVCRHLAAELKHDGALCDSVRAEDCREV